MNGKQVNRSTKCEKKADAERLARDYVDKLRHSKTKAEVVEKIRQVVSDAQPMPLDFVWEAYLKQPKRKRQSDKQLLRIKGIWIDFKSFCQDRGRKHLAQIRAIDASEYFKHITSHGRYIRTVEYRRKSNPDRVSAKMPPALLSSRTLIVYHKSLTQVINSLLKVAALPENPFNDVPRPELISESREVYTAKELRDMLDSDDQFAVPIVKIGLYTGLREEDICTLRPSEICLSESWITRITEKTNKPVRIPILPELRLFLEQLDMSGEYVLPIHAAMYRSNPSGISKRFRRFLRGLGIVTTKEVEGRRDIVLKDIHSLRHTFVWVAINSGISLDVIQSIVGHMSPKMTMMYADHADDQAKKSLQLDFFGQSGNPLLKFSDEDIMTEFWRRFSNRT